MQYIKHQVYIRRVEIHNWFNKVEFIFFICILLSLKKP